ncbi:MAG TPA: biopolymer transporter ExbD [Veillonellaceae bacterium]|nr:biopolymer transporter ExbD [Veillonellaceae bacterium]
MIKLERRRHHHVGIMISPMIDMSFLLLVFFVVNTMTMSEVNTVPVQLPSASSAQLEESTPFAVTVKEDGSLYLGKTPVTRDVLLARAKERASKDPSFSIVIYGDGKVSYESIVKLLDDCKEAGITRVGLAVEQAAPHES